MDIDSGNWKVVIRFVRDEMWVRDSRGWTMVWYIFTRREMEAEGK